MTGTSTINTKKYSKLLAETLPVVITTETELTRLQDSAAMLMRIGDEKRTNEQDRILSLLAVLIENYEKEKYPLGGSSPREILHHLLEENGYRQKDLVGIFKSEANISEVLAGTRGISKNKAKELGDFFQVSYKLFL
ncbi:MAG: helix-turn-helix domain-containing protein [Pyrinomonadaceae bacterium]